MKFILILIWLTPSDAEWHHQQFAEPVQCHEAMRSIAAGIHARIDTQLIYAGCSPVAPGMLEGKRA